MKYLILRRISQILILGLFFASNYYGVKILQGNLSSSLLFGACVCSFAKFVLAVLSAGVKFDLKFAVEIFKFEPLIIFNPLRLYRIKTTFL